MFRTEDMTEQTRTNEGNSLQDIWRSFTVGRRNSKGMTQVTEAVRRLLWEYRRGYEYSGDTLSVLYQATEIVWTEHEDMYPLAYLFLERMSFPGHDEPFLDTVGGQFYKTFGRPMLPVSKLNIEIMRMIVGGVVDEGLNDKVLERIVGGHGLIQKGVRNAWDFTNRSLERIYPRGITTFKPEDFQ